MPVKILDAPLLEDDYYLNLLDWSSRNELVVGLDSVVYIWAAESSKVTKLDDYGDHDSVTSVSWAKAGSLLAVGSNSGLVKVWDVAAQKVVRVYKGSKGRVGSLAWSSNTLSSGCKDGSIHNRDLKEKFDYVSKLYHRQEVCGLKWSPDDAQLASGGNDNRLIVWNP
jgi:cell division cycle 20-like protein 1, cofactor of APC complex